MKISTIVLAFIIVCVSSNVYAQDCLVALESIKGTYEGDCDKGKASGKGKATGADIYEGEFKNGLPDGQGKYNWKNKNFYVGSMKKGLRDGKGEMHYILTSGYDSTVTGFWKKDKYLGLYEKPYEIKTVGSRISKVDCRLSEKGGEEIQFRISVVGGGPASLTQIVPTAGTYLKQNTQMMNSMSITRIQQVVYPFRAIFTFSNGDNIEILFNEKANYDVDVVVM